MTRTIITCGLGDKILQAPTSLSAQKRYFSIKSKKHSNRFIFNKVIDITNKENFHREIQEALSSNSNKPILKVFRTSTHQKEKTAVNHLGAVVYKGKVYIVGTTSWGVKDDYIGKDYQKKENVFFPNAELQADGFSCDIYAYKMGKYLIESLLSGSENIETSKYNNTTKAPNWLGEEEYQTFGFNENGEKNEEYNIFTIPKEFFKYAQKINFLIEPEDLQDYKDVRQKSKSEFEKHWKIAQKDELSGNSKLCFHNLKRFILNGKKEHLKEWYQLNNDINRQLKPELSKIIKSYLDGQLSDTQYRDTVHKHLSNS